MAVIRERSFPEPDSLRCAVAALILDHLRQDVGIPHAILLSGGQTPLPIYEQASAGGVVADADCHVLYTDERMVPTDSPLSNYGNTRQYLARMGIREDCILRVDTRLEAGGAAHAYDEAIRRFFRKGGRITLGLLGLGADGHTASLFTLDDIRRGEGVMALSVPRPEKPDRVSVTPDLLKRVETLIFVVSGPGKREAIDRLLGRPETLPAGRAVCEARNVQLWTA